MKHVSVDFLCACLSNRENNSNIAKGDNLNITKGNNSNITNGNNSNIAKGENSTMTVPRNRWHGKANGFSIVHKQQSNRF